MAGGVTFVITKYIQLDFVESDGGLCDTERMSIGKMWTNVKSLQYLLLHGHKSHSFLFTIHVY